VLILEKSVIDPGTLEWVSAATGKRRKKFVASTLEELAADYDLCISGPALELAVKLDPLVLKFLRYVKVFARTSPDQKEIVLAALKDAGLHTLFCGDGTNDVGALKQAHIGVALLSGSGTPSSGGAAMTNAGPASGGAVRNGVPQAVVESGGSAAASGGTGKLRQRRKPATNGAGRSNGVAPGCSNKSPEEMQKEEIARRLEELKESLREPDDQAPLVKLGDASIASPFTSRRMTIESCITIIREGRCTLATTSQMYQILALNCLISAYSLSVLYLEGVVFGDRQLTITSLAMAVSFFMISRSKPLKKLSPERPPVSVFAPQLFLSLLGQFAVHLVSLYYLTEIARGYVPYGPKNSIDAAFRPSVFNTVIFLLSIAQQVNVFTVNYKGRPFMQGLTENRMLLRSLLFVGGIVLMCTFEISPDVNELMELTPWPDSIIQFQVAKYIALDFSVAWLWDKLMCLLFAPRKGVIQYYSR
jgi:manganese-transporting P-type ATPase